MTLISTIHVDVVSLLEEVTDQILNTYFTTSCKTSFCFIKYLGRISLSPHFLSPEYSEIVCFHVAGE